MRTNADASASDTQRCGATQGGQLQHNRWKPPVPDQSKMSLNRAFDYKTRLGARIQHHLDHTNQAISNNEGKQNFEN